MGMVLILDGSSESFVMDIYFKPTTAIDVNKCLKQIKLPNFLHMYARYPRLPSNIGTMSLGLLPGHVVTRQCSRSGSEHLKNNPDPTS